METTKFKTSNVAVCLKAINDYVNMDEGIVPQEEQKQLKEKAKKATNHLSILFAPEPKNIFLETCPADELPTIL